MATVDVPPGEKRLWGAEPVALAFSADCLVVEGMGSELAKALELSLFWVGEREHCLGLLPSTLADLPTMEGGATVIDLRHENVRLAPGVALVLQVHNFSKQSLRLRGAVFGSIAGS